MSAHHAATKCFMKHVFYASSSDLWPLPFCLKELEVTIFGLEGGAEKDVLIGSD